MAKLRDILGFEGQLTPNKLTPYLWQKALLHSFLLEGQNHTDTTLI